MEVVAEVEVEVALPLLAVKTLRFNSLTDGAPTMRPPLTIEAGANFLDDADDDTSLPLFG